MWRRVGEPPSAAGVELVRAEPAGPLYVSENIEPMELRRERLRKPGPPR
jgi:hypothetical protein